MSSYGVRVNMHWHAYTWTGNGEDRDREIERRPGSPEFAGSRVPPMRTGDWLARPASHIAATFDDPGRAVEWLAARYAALRRADGVGAEIRLENAADALPRGVDVQWGEWLKGGRFAAAGVVCCPNRHAGHPCPIRRPHTAAGPTSSLR